MAHRELMNFEFQFFTMVTSQALGFVTSITALMWQGSPPDQRALYPWIVDLSNTWVPVAVLVSIVILAIISTYQVTKFVIQVRNDIEALKESRKKKEENDE